MEKLFPIIRRKRRPLVEENPQPVKAEAKPPVVEPPDNTKPKKPREDASKN